MAFDDGRNDTGIDSARRLLLGGMVAAAGAVAAGSVPAAAKSNRASTAPVSEADLRAHIETVVVIYAENRSFNNLFVDFPGLQEPLSQVSPERMLQRDRDGRVLERLPKIWEGLVPAKQVVEHR